MLNLLAKYKPVLIALLVPYLWLAGVRMVSLEDGGEASTDTFYHVAMADRFPGACVAQDFPWTTLSIWKDHFYDKELLFHAALRAVRSYGAWMGLPSGPPFHLPALTFDLLLLAVFALFANALRIPRLYFFCAALVMFCPFFTQRLLMLRPHVVAITIMLACLWNLAARPRPWLSFSLGMLAAYSYSNPHFILLPALVYAALVFRTDRRVALKVPVVTLLGVLAGLTLHPQFPNTFILWKIQCVDVIRQSLLQESPLSLGAELSRPYPRWFAQNAALFALALVNAWALGALLKRRRWNDIAVDTRLLVVMQGLGVIGVFFSMRVTEYAWPFALLAAGVLLRDLRRENLLREFSARARWAAHVLMVVGFLGLGLYVIRWVAPHQTRELHGFPGWAKQNIPDGTVIANPEWTDFPVLFYGAPQFRYLLGIEPMFGYSAMPETVARLEAFRARKAVLSPAELGKLTGSRYAFVSARHEKLARFMHECGYYFIYQESDGWLFDLGFEEKTKN